LCQRWPHPRPGPGLRPGYPRRPRGPGRLRCRPRGQGRHRQDHRHGIRPAPPVLVRLRRRGLAHRGLQEPAGDAGRGRGARQLLPPRGRRHEAGRRLRGRPHKRLQRRRPQGAGGGRRLRRPHRRPHRQTRRPRSQDRGTLDLLRGVRGAGLRQSLLLDPRPGPPPPRRPMIHSSRHLNTDTQTLLLYLAGLLIYCITHVHDLHALSQCASVIKISFFKNKVQRLFFIASFYHYLSFNGPSPPPPPAPLTQLNASLLQGVYRMTLRDSIIYTCIKHLFILRQRHIATLLRCNGSCALL
jgi:hypothetical protein